MTAVGALSPLHAAEHITEGVTEYLTTSFALVEGSARNELQRFLTDPTHGMFHGPYVRTRLPYQQATGWENILSWLPSGFTPYKHQAQAFERWASEKKRGRTTTATNDGRHRNGFR